VTADEIITQARELDPAFTVQRHTRRVAINFLSRLQRRLVAEWAKLEETSNAETYVVNFPLVDFDLGEELLDAESVPAPLKITAIQRPLDLWLLNADRPRSIDLIRWGDRNRHASPAAYLVENRMHFTGHVEDYNDVDRVEFTYTPTPEDVTDPAADLILPLTAEDACVAHMAAFFARRSNDKELSRARREYIQESLDAEALWLDEIRRREGATITRTVEAW
jgi:hypothetical protein